MINDNRQILTVAEVSAFLRVCPAKVYKLLRRGDISAFHCGGVWCIPKDSLSDYVNVSMKKEN